jgi:hypothetical protein
MNKIQIKHKLIESLTALGLFEDEDSNTKQDYDNADNKKDEDETDGEKKIEYNDVINFFKKHPTIKQVGVFREAGFSEEEIYQRLPYKKLNKEKNDMGGVYTFDKSEVDRIRTVLSKYPGGGRIAKK